jgi:large subunit ribosomal protein L17
MLANMVTSLFDKERITTTDAKAKEARRAAERLITRAKKGYTAYQEHQTLKEAGKEAEAKQMQAVALAHWRQAGRVVKKQAVLKKLFDVIAPQFLNREGGYTRILHLGNRLGDNEKTVLLELVGTEITSKPIRRGKRSEEEDSKDDKGKKSEEKKASAKEEKPKKKTKTKKTADKKKKESDS